MALRNSSPAAAADRSFAHDADRRDALDFQLLGEGTVHEWAARPENKRAWNELHDACPWSTAFQSPAFFDIWCRHYGRNFPPLLVIARDERGTLVGIMPLATNGTVITGLGTHQAEYNGWLCDGRDAVAFVSGALDTVARAAPEKSLRLRYLPPATPQAVIDYLNRRNDRVILTRHHVHEFALDPLAIERSLKKKGNKSKLNRLKRQGELDVRRLDAEGLAVHLRRIVTMYDFRQGAMNGVCPFLDDPRKAAFHLDWIKGAPQQLHASALMVDDELVSGLLLVTSKTGVHLAISAHAPEHAENSPMKFHLYRAALALAEEGRRTLDLTPGGDSWKERFSTDVRDVWELVMHRSQADATRERAVEAAKNLIRRTLSLVGLSVPTIRGFLRTVRQTPADAATASRRGDPSTIDFRVDPAQLGPLHSTIDVRANDLELLLRRGPEFARQPRQKFLSRCLARIEHGERFYTATNAGEIVCLAWLSKDRERMHDVTFSSSETAERSLTALLAHAVDDFARAKPIVVTLHRRERAALAVLRRLGSVVESDGGARASQDAR